MEQRRPDEGVAGMPRFIPHPLDDAGEDRGLGRKFDDAPQLKEGIDPPQQGRGQDLILARQPAKLGGTLGDGQPFGHMLRAEESGVLGVELRKCGVGVDQR